MTTLKITTFAAALAIGLTTQHAQAQSILPNIFGWGNQNQLTNFNACGPNGCATPGATPVRQYPTQALPAYPAPNGIHTQNWTTGRPDYNNHSNHNHQQGTANGPARNRFDGPNQNDYRIQPHPQNFNAPQYYNQLPHSNVNQIPRNTTPTVDPRFPTPTFTNYYMNSNVPQRMPVGYGNNFPNL